MPGRRSSKPIPPGLPTDDPRDLYVQKCMSVRDIAVMLKGRHGCSQMQLQRRCKREGWMRLRTDWDAKVNAETLNRTALTEASHRARLLERTRAVEGAMADALKKLLPRVKSGKRLLGEKQGAVSAMKEIAQTFELTQGIAAELVDDRDDRFTRLLAAAEEVAGVELTEVTDLTTDEELLEAMTVKGLDDLSEVIKPKLDQQAEGAAPVAPTTEAAT